MNVEAIKNKLEEWLQPELEARNLFLVDIKFPNSRQIEVYIDSDEGIHISECAELSRLLEKNIDGSGLLPENYILEVSSPGMENPLLVPRQYKRRIGRVFEVLKTDGTQLEAQLVEADEEKIKLREVVAEKKKKKTTVSRQQTTETPREWTLKFDEIKKAVLQFKF